MLTYGRCGSPLWVCTSPNDVAELNADLASPLVTAVVFDSKHRVMMARIWAAEVPEQADLIRAQLGVGPWANGSIAPGGWGLLHSHVGEPIGLSIHGLPRSSRLPPSVMVRAVPRTPRLAPGRRSVWPRRLPLLRRTASVGPPVCVRRVPLALASQVMWRPALLRALV